MYRIEAERDADWWEVEALYDLCFAPGREALSSYRLRDGVVAVAELSRVARDELGVLGGAIRFWPVRIGTAEALLLGPIAVHPTRQGEGLGRLLMQDSLAAAEAAGWARVLLVGDAP
ncbi:MAG: N-acetyltransferase, partial [Pseudomonadota bacterium]